MSERDEIAQIIYDNFWPNFTEDSLLDGERRSADALIAAGYRKIPTRRELEAFRWTSVNGGAWCLRTEEIDAIIAQGWGRENDGEPDEDHQDREASQEGRVVVPGASAPSEAVQEEAQAPQTT